MDDDGIDSIDTQKDSSMPPPLYAPIGIAEGQGRSKKMCKISGRTKVYRSSQTRFKSALYITMQQIS